MAGRLHRPGFSVLSSRCGDIRDGEYRAQQRLKIGRLQHRLVGVLRRLPD
jgi:hypothetical protein